MQPEMNCLYSSYLETMVCNEILKQLPTLFCTLSANIFSFKNAFFYESVALALHAGTIGNKTCLCILTFHRVVWTPPPSCGNNSRNEQIIINFRRCQRSLQHQTMVNWSPRPRSTRQYLRYRHQLAAPLPFPGCSFISRRIWITVRLRW